MKTGEASFVSKKVAALLRNKKHGDQGSKHLNLSNYHTDFCLKEYLIVSLLHVTIDKFLYIQYHSPSQIATFGKSMINGDFQIKKKNHSLRLSCETIVHFFLSIQYIEQDAHPNRTCAFFMINFEAGVYIS